MPFVGCLFRVFLCLLSVVCVFLFVACGVCCLVVRVCLRLRDCACVFVCVVLFVVVCNSVLFCANVC